MENGAMPEDPLCPPDPDPGQRIFLVPYSWWKDAHDSIADCETDGKSGVLYTATPVSSYVGPMKLINNIFSPDLAFNLRREDDPAQYEEKGQVGVSGCDFALVPADMWLEALKWHMDAKVAKKGSGAFSAAKDDMSDVYPLQLRLSVFQESNVLGIKISKKDNATEWFRRACRIFSVDSQMRIWDFSGQTSLYVLNEKSKCAKDIQRQSDPEVILELQIYGLSDNIKGRDGKKDEVATQQNGTYRFMNGFSGCVSTDAAHSTSSALSGKPREAGSLGLTGLQNLGNTCFMNSAVQCLAHTPKLVDYFLGDYCREINHDNPLGMDGEIALAFGDLIRKLWAPGATSVAPKTFKSKLARFAPQFSGFNQHDSQELLAFLLDGLHEDLNRVKSKPYVQAKDEEGRLHEEIADEYWCYHLARNDSIIVDVCQGQYKSTLVCPVCKKVSVTFDPFMYLSLPLPSSNTRSMTVTVVSAEGSTKPSMYTVDVPKDGKSEDLIQALGVACSLVIDENLLVAEVYNSSIIRFLEEPTDSLSLIRDGDKLVAYRMKKYAENSRLIVFKHQRMEEQYIHGKTTSTWRVFGIPLVGTVSDSADGFTVHKLYLNLLAPFQLPMENALNGECSESTAAPKINGLGDNGECSENTAAPEVSGLGDNGECSESTASPEVNGLGDNGECSESTAAAEVNGLGDNGDYASCHPEPSSSEGAQLLSNNGLEFSVMDEKGIIGESKIEMNQGVPVAGVSKRLNLLVSLPKKQLERYDVQLLCKLPEVFKYGFFVKRPQESLPLYKCLEAFLKEEPLGPEDMWYCPTCKKHCQASKKLDLWRLPEILVIHLKRFSYTRYMKNKIERFVDFPVDNLDLSPYISYKNGQSNHRYMLYAISNHMGSMGGGHYTAYVHHGGDKWYDFDDSVVHPISQDKIKTSAAYVLFYRRVLD